MEEDRTALIKETIKRLTPKGECPYEVQVAKATSHIEGAMDALSRETRERIEATMQAGWTLTPAQFRELIRPWKRAEIASLLGIRVGTTYYYSKRGRGALNHVPAPTAKKIIELRKQFNREHNITSDPLLESILGMGEK